MPRRPDARVFELGHGSFFSVTKVQVETRLIVPTGTLVFLPADQSCGEFCRPVSPQQKDGTSGATLGPNISGKWKPKQGIDSIDRKSS